MFQLLTVLFGCVMDAANNVWIESALGAIKAFAFVCDIITYPVYLLLQRPWEKRRMSRRVKAKPVHMGDKSVTFRSVQGPQTVHSKMLANGIDTMEKMLLYVVEQFKKKRCLGTREILADEDEIQPNGRVFKKYVLGDYKWKTYEEVNMLASNFGKGLRELGHMPKQNIVIFAETRAEWMVAAHGCFKQNIPEFYRIFFEIIIK
ncbi:hypothetical protein LSTR_LSTR006880 [Laodelphax striatellus]|uniref:long-chain-fatty-acid--CoA ligase n=1 Tax=Laodelphax striatellus TaxID=195883 RepID=A0A482XFH8_LAOST|nr:hypothetical protein LSTR_LSTR006880 [Laodelphax striatellus]